MTPTFTSFEAKTQATFQALMTSLSYPGRVCHLPPNITALPDNFLAVGETLLDLETSFFTPDADLAAQLARTTATAKSASQAAYHFYPRLTVDHLSDLAQASIGDMLYPDRAATLIIGATFGTGATLTLTGPGIPTETVIQITDIPTQLWELRQQTSHYPLGWDIFLLAGNAVIGLPRTTQIHIGLD